VSATRLLIAHLSAGIGLIAAVQASAHALNERCAPIALVGNNAPYEDLRDGEFDDVRSNQRQLHPSPFWQGTAVEGKAGVGIDFGRMSSGGNPGSFVVSNPVEWPQGARAIKAGDVLQWSFAAKAKYETTASIAFALQFGDRLVPQRSVEALPYNAAPSAIFSGEYRVTAKDLTDGPLRLRFDMASQYEVPVLIEYADLRIAGTCKAPLDSLSISLDDGAPRLAWQAAAGAEGYDIYRSKDARSGFAAIARAQQGTSYIDRTAPGGVANYYVVTRAGATAADLIRTSVARFVVEDHMPPPPPQGLAATAGDFDVQLAWRAADTADGVASYAVYRRSGDQPGFRRIADLERGPTYRDFSPTGGGANQYYVQAIDTAGNASVTSPIVTATPKSVRGAAFIDLIRPMPVRTGLVRGAWGTDEISPRDVLNGIEDPAWSYWGGAPRRLASGQYGMYVARWPEDARRGHWEWPFSTVAYAVADDPLGPYKVIRETAYNWDGGKGHNPDVMRINDGTYVMHLAWGHMLTAERFEGPWTYRGKVTLDKESLKGHDAQREVEFQYYVNRSGMQRPDGSFLMMTKFGRMTVSDHLLGPYKVISDSVFTNPTIPEEFRKWNYEDPVMWCDKVQCHMIINAFIARRAIYLRSPDGIDWYYDSGLAYDPSVTRYEDGTDNYWHKLERPHVVLDQYSRATHLSVAVTDIVKEEDYANDGHGAKNLILPLTVAKRLDLLNRNPIGTTTPEIRVLVHAESGFDPHRDIDMSSVRYGAASAVNLGRGSPVLRTQRKGADLVLIFSGAKTELASNDFAAKLLGKDARGDILFGYTKVTAR